MACPRRKLNLGCHSKAKYRTTERAAMHLVRIVQTVAEHYPREASYGCDVLCRSRPPVGRRVLRQNGFRLPKRRRGVIYWPDCSGIEDRKGLSKKHTFPPNRRLALLDLRGWLSKRSFWAVSDSGSTWALQAYRRGSSPLRSTKIRTYA